MYLARDGTKIESTSTFSVILYRLETVSETDCIMNWREEVKYRSFQYPIDLTVWSIIRAYAVFWYVNWIHCCNVFELIFDKISSDDLGSCVIKEINLVADTKLRKFGGIFSVGCFIVY